MSKNKRLTWFTVITLLIGAIGFGIRPSAEGAPAKQDDRHGHNPLAEIPVTGAILTGGTFAGTLDITSFVVENNQLLATGNLEGTLRDVNGRRIGTVENVFVNGFPVSLGTS